MSFYKVKNKHNRVVKIPEGEKWVAPLAEAVLTAKQWKIAKADFDLIEKVDKAEIEGILTKISEDPDDIETILNKDSAESVDNWLKRVSGFDKIKRDELVKRGLEASARMGKHEFYHKINDAYTIMILPNQ